MATLTETQGTAKVIAAATSEGTAATKALRGDDKSSTKKVLTIPMVDA